MRCRPSGLASPACLAPPPPPADTLPCTSATRGGTPLSLCPLRTGSLAWKKPLKPHSSLRGRVMAAWLPQSQPDPVKSLRRATRERPLLTPPQAPVRVPAPPGPVSPADTPQHREVFAGPGSGKEVSQLCPAPCVPPTLLLGPGCALQPLRNPRLRENQGCPGRSSRKGCGCSRQRWAAQPPARRAPLHPRAHTPPAACSGGASCLLLRWWLPNPYFANIYFSEKQTKVATASNLAHACAIPPALTLPETQTKVWATITALTWGVSCHWGGAG